MTAAKTYDARPPPAEPVAIGSGRTAYAANLSTVAVLCSIVAASVLGLWPAWRLLHYQWTATFSYSHGYLIAAMALVLIGRALGAEAVKPRPWWPGFALLALVIGAVAIANVLAINVARMGLVPFALWGAVLAAAGPLAAKRTAAGFGYLYFAIPVWDVLIGPLQSATTAAVTVALTVGRVPAFIEGNFIHLPSGTFQIAEGCSGLHFLIVGVAFSVFYGSIRLQSWPRRALLVGSALLMAVLANWVRVFLLVIVGHVTEMQSSLVHDHYTFGWILFVAMMAPVFLLGRKLEAERSIERALPAGAPSIRAGARVGTATLACGVAAALLAAPALLRLQPPPEANRVVPLVLQIPAGWRETTVADDAWGPSFDRAPQSLRAAVGHAALERPIDVYVARYPVQTPAAKLIHYRNRLYGADWQLERTSSAVVALPSGGSAAAAELTLVRNSQRRLVRYWYRVGGQLTTSRVGARLLDVLALMRGRRDAVVVAVSAECGVNCDAARRELDEFLADAAPALFALSDGTT